MEQQNYDLTPELAEYVLRVIDWWEHPQSSGFHGDEHHMSYEDALLLQGKLIDEGILLPANGRKRVRLAS